MKKILVLVSMFVAMNAFADKPTKVEKCSTDALVMATTASADAAVENLVEDITSSFESCTKTMKYYYFPADCGRFTYTDHTYTIKTKNNGQYSFVVRDGGISCTANKVRIINELSYTQENPSRR